MSRKLLHGVGVNDAVYATQNSVFGKKVICPFFQRWKNMMDRCYSSKYLEGNASYVGCSVAPEWRQFSNFKMWMEKQNWVDMDLDKDLTVRGNKVYSEDTCSFIPRVINTALGIKKSAKGIYPIGVHKRCKGRDMISDYNLSYVASYLVFEEGRKTQCFKTPALAHEAWQLAKIRYLQRLVLAWREQPSYNTSVSTTLLAASDAIYRDVLACRETLTF